MNHKKDEPSLAKKSILMYQEVLELMLPVLEALDEAKREIEKSSLASGLKPNIFFNWGLDLILKELHLGSSVLLTEEEEDDDEEEEEDEEEEGDDE